MKQLLIANGFKYTSMCNCKGPQTQIWEDGKGYRVDFNVTQTTYWLKKRSPVLYADIAWGPAERLESDLKKHLPQ